MDLVQDFKEFIELLNKHQVEYMIVGGYSVAYHGYVRYTGDIDIWVNPNGVNAERIMLALSDFGFGTIDLSVEDFIEPDRVVQFGVAPLRIDLMTSVSGLPDFDKIKERTQIVTIDNLSIPMIGYADLISNKKHTDRPKDKLDIQELSEIKKREQANQKSQKE
jgi:predicted nucleotidyltransferase